MKTKILLCILFLGMNIPQTAHANAGLPMIILVWPIFWIALLPIITIEWMIIKKALTAPSRRILLSVSLANIISTFLGIPLTWLFMVGIQLIIPGGSESSIIDGFSILGPLWNVTVRAPWLFPSIPRWGIFVAFFVLLLPFFMVSYWIERVVIAKFLKSEPGVSQQQIKKIVWKANGYSYLFLTVIGLLLTIIMIVFDKEI